MRTKLHSFPSVSLSDVNKFDDTITRHARAFAHNKVQQARETRPEEQIIENTKKGSRAKVAACLVNDRDPIEMVDWIYVGGFSEGYAYLGIGERESYAIQVKLDDISDDKIRIACPSRKYSYMTRQIEKYNQYSRFTEFVTYDPESELYFHLGRLSTDNFKEPVDVVGYDVIFEFSIAPKTNAAIKPLAAKLAMISQERIKTEFIKILESNKPSIGIELAKETGLLGIFLPEISQTEGVEQNKFHLTVTFFICCNVQSI